MGIKVEGISKQFGAFQALRDIDLEVETGSLVALLGPSGSGKSTLLRMVAGLEQPDSGRIYLTGEDATDRRVQDRQVGFVFQHYALFKHLTVRRNIAFGLELRKWPQPRIKEKVNELLDLIQLAGLGDRYPSQLSGGQRQRVALARALAVEPGILLLDEPFGALDAKVRKDLRAWLRRLHDEVHVTTVFVTHDQEEAMEVADDIVVMNHGRIEQVGSPAEIYDHPATPFVMSFVGPVNVLPNHATLFQDSKLEVPHPEVFVRPHDVDLLIEPTEGATTATLQRLVHLGNEVQVEVRLEDGQTLNAHLSRENFRQLGLEPGHRVYVKPRRAQSFPVHYSI
jgi:sulfate/thiosulfate transport system ATP-binding protein